MLCSDWSELNVFNLQQLLSKFTGIDITDLIFIFIWCTCDNRFTHSIGNGDRANAQTFVLLLKHPVRRATLMDFIKSVELQPVSVFTAAISGNFVNRFLIHPPNPPIEPLTWGVRLHSSCSDTDFPQLNIAKTDKGRTQETDAFKKCKDLFLRYS